MFSFKKPSFIFASITAVALLGGQGFAQEVDEPIAFVGHGAMFGQSGTEIIPTPEFLEMAVGYYEKALTERLSKDLQEVYKEFQDTTQKSFPDSKLEQLQGRAALLVRMARLADFGDEGRTLGKIGVLARFSNYDVSKIERGKDTWALPKKMSFDEAKMKEMEEFLEGRMTGVFKLVTTNGSAAYRQECLDAGVPAPLEFSDVAWDDYDQIPQTQLFIVSGLQATVRAMSSTNPPGKCIALPRHGPETSQGAGDGNVQLDGIICMGQTTGNVCFWDNQGASILPNQVFEFPLNNPPPIAQWVGGADLLASIGGVCSDCHSGENPYVIHPSSVGLGTVSSALDLFPNVWPDPFVQAGWPENPGPMNSPDSCDLCHGDAAGPAGSAGRFPHLSTALPGYCSMVLRSAVGALAPRLVGTNATPTMPTFDPGNQACTPNLDPGNTDFRQCSAIEHTEDCTPAGVTNSDLNVSCTPQLRSMFDWCGLAANNDAGGRGDPHQTTVDRVKYDFQSAGEFVYLESPTDRFELQARQTAVPSQGIIRANRHTGLSSCVSVITSVAARLGKHRVTFQQPPEGSKDKPVLRINGRFADLPKKGIDLGQGGRILPGGNSGIILEAPDGSRIRVATNWWEHHQIWYMNIVVENTPARDGVLGMVGSSDWLPSLSDGSSLGKRPASLADRHGHVHEKFADSWRVTDTTSLFDYAGGQSTKDFTFPDWPPFNGDCEKAPGLLTKPTKPMDEREAARFCAEIKDKELQQECIFDVAVTGEAGFAKLYQ